jgi:S-ribosylhomocysteine lyase LuxS involved in autoinducer biosynthesis
MNERIRELAKQATTITYEDDGWRLYGTEVETFNKQKFAELIVRECAEYAEHELDMAGYKKKFMLKHFGVEE